MNRMVVVKGRERLFRGVLMNFEDLPIDKQKNFINIKLVIEEYLKTNIEAYVFGSYNHGYWDDESDYDVIILSSASMALDEIVKEKTNLKVNVFFTENKLGNIMIP